MWAPLAKTQNFGTLYLRNPVLFGAKNLTDFFLPIDLPCKKKLDRLENFFWKVFDLAWFAPYTKIIRNTIIFLEINLGKRLIWNEFSFVLHFRWSQTHIRSPRITLNSSDLERAFNSEATSAHPLTGFFRLPNNFYQL